MRRVLNGSNPLFGKRVVRIPRFRQHASLAQRESVALTRRGSQVQIL